MKNMFRVLPLLLLLGGCASLKAYPDVSTDWSAELATMNKYLEASAITRYDSRNDSDRDGLNQQEWRNLVVNARVRAIDIHFNDFQQKLFREGIGF